MTQTTFVAPVGSASVVGADGVVYPVVNGSVTMPISAVPSGMFAAGFNKGSAAGATGHTGGTGSTGSTGGGGTGATGATGTNGEITNAGLPAALAAIGVSGILKRNASFA